MVCWFQHKLSLVYERLCVCSARCSIKFHTVSSYVAYCFCWFALHYKVLPCCYRHPCNLLNALHIAHNAVLQQEKLHAFEHTEMGAQRWLRHSIRHTVLEYSKPCSFSRLAYTAD